MRAKRQKGGSAEPTEPPWIRHWAWKPRVNAYSWPNPPISATAHAQCAEGLHFSAFHFTSAVSLDLLSEGSTCPSVPVTAQCCVKQPIDPVDLLLSWQCTGLDGMPKERLVLCDDGRVSKLICQFGEVYDIMGVCTSVGNETVITSEATFNTTTLCDMLLFCSYGGDEKQHISVTIQGKLT